VLKQGKTGAKVAGSERELKEKQNRERERESEAYNLARGLNARASI
jgi:hypothetical protein